MSPQGDRGKRSTLAKGQKKNLWTTIQVNVQPARKKRSETVSNLAPGANVRGKRGAKYRQGEVKEKTAGGKYRVTDKKDHPKDETPSRCQRVGDDESVTAISRERQLSWEDLSVIPQMPLGKFKYEMTCTRVDVRGISTRGP